MKHLIAYTEEGAKQFCQAAFSGLQPTPTEGVTTAWTDYILHPTTSVPLISIPEPFEVPIAADVNVALFDFAFQKYLEDGTIAQSQVDALKAQTLAAGGGHMDLGAAVVALFQGTTKMIDYVGAVSGGWISASLE